MTTLDPAMHPGSSPGVSQRDRSMLAHDLRGALQGVMGGVALLDRARLSPEALDQIDRVAASAKLLACLVNDLLGQEMAPERRVAYSHVEIPRFLRHLARRWNGEALESGGSFRIEADPDLPMLLQADLVSLARALGNLIGNALRYGKAGEVRLGVRRTAEGGMTFVVTDEGPGLAAETIESVWRTGALASSVLIDGHGLGLHIVRKLCAEMGGSFTLSNRSGGGAQASLSFPASLCAAAPADAPGSGAGAAPSKPMDLGGLRILLAEDNPTNQMVATQMLRALNAEVTLTSDGVEALERFETSEFDMVVVDIEMPRMSGLDVIRAIRGRTDGRDRVPIVALTAYAMREHRERIAAAGANGLISKPITSVEALGLALAAHAVPARPAAAPPQVAADPAASVTDEPVADLDIYDALCAAIGMGMMAELLEKVVADLLQARADLAGGLSPLDRKPIRSASHILISVAGAIGATRLQACARALNTAAYGEGGSNLPGDVRRCLDEIDAAVAFARSRHPAG